MQGNRLLCCLKPVCKASRSKELLRNMPQWRCRAVNPDQGALTSGNFAENAWAHAVASFKGGNF